jgi:hypothetical protein
VSNDELDRQILVFVKGSDGTLLSGANIEFFVDDQPAGSVENGTGRASLQVPSTELDVRVSARYGGEEKEARLAAAATTHTFQFDTPDVAGDGKGMANTRNILIALGVASVLGFGYWLISRPDIVNDTDLVAYCAFCDAAECNCDPDQKRLRAAACTLENKEYLKECRNTDSGIDAKSEKAGAHLNDCIERTIKTNPSLKKLLEASPDPAAWEVYKANCKKEAKAPEYDVTVNVHSSEGSEHRLDPAKVRLKLPTSGWVEGKKTSGVYAFHIKGIKEGTLVEVAVDLDGWQLETKRIELYSGARDVAMVKKEPPDPDTSDSGDEDTGGPVSVACSQGIKNLVGNLLPPKNTPAQVLKVRISGAGVPSAGNSDATKLLRDSGVSFKAKGTVPCHFDFDWHP